MKAAVLEGPGTIVYREFPTPRPGKGESLLQVKATSICGSDMLRAYHGEARFFPLIQGHECAGLIAEVGEGLDRDLIGRPASLAPLVPCFECPACRRNLFSACTRYSFIGSRRHGGHAEYLTAPLQNLILLPEGIGFELGAILEPSTVALHVLDRSGFRPAHQVAVFGAGAIGLCAVQWLRIKGARSIIAVDVVEENLEAARSLGAHEIVDARREDVVARIRELTGDGVDGAYEMAGAPQTFQQAVMSVRAGGVVVCLGNLPRESAFPSTVIEHLIRQELEIRGTWMSYSHPFPGHEWTDSIQAIVKGDLKLDDMISHRFPLSEAPQVFTGMHERSFKYRKVMLKP